MTRHENSFEAREQQRPSRSVAIAIAGAGISGLTTTRALRKTGVDVRVFERADQLRATGSGITVQANAMQALQTLGVAEEIADAGHLIDGGVLGKASGEVITRLTMKDVLDRIGHYGVTIHRSRLVEILARPVSDCIEFDRGVKSVQGDGGKVIARFDNGDEQQFDGLIGCDGLHSSVRRSLRGEEPLRYAGYTTWRGTSTSSVDGLSSGEFCGAGRRFGFSALGPDEVYWFAVDDAPEGQSPTEPILEEVRSRFEGWAPVVQDLLDSTAERSVLRTDVHDRPPATMWGSGNITLLGDAAHPMTPNLGQGGSQAIEDAVVLGRSLDVAGSIEEGFRRYETLRRPRANRFVEQSRKMGEIAQWKNPVARAMRNVAMRLIPKSLTQKRLKRMYDFEGWYSRNA